ncbi:MAG TPA: PASTA domain-containing protein [Longimicrobiales bacterium]|nr:PASTA domain-containing protein [Longimicrobiales bacterium]
MGRWLLAALVILLTSFGVGYLVSTQLLFPAPETAGTGVAVPGLYGMDREEAEGAVVAAGFGVGRVEVLAGADIPAGQVMAQSPIAGQQLRRGAAVDMTLSAGAPELRVPPVEGLGASAARDLLRESGFAVDVKQVPAQTPAGAVARMDPVSGTTVQLPATITLFVSLGPPRVDSVLPPAGPPGGTP